MTGQPFLTSDPAADALNFSDASSDEECAPSEQVSFEPGWSPTQEQSFCRPLVSSDHSRPSCRRNIVRNRRAALIIPQEFKAPGPKPGTRAASDEATDAYVDWLRREIIARHESIIRLRHAVALQRAKNAAKAHMIAAMDNSEAHHSEVSSGEDEAL